MQCKLFPRIVQYVQRWQVNCEILNIFIFLWYNKYVDGCVITAMFFKIYLRLVTMTN